MTQTGDSPLQICCTIVFLNREALSRSRAGWLGRSEGSAEGMFSFVRFALSPRQHSPLVAVGAPVLPSRFEAITESVCPSVSSI
ncbi:hypothetical protein AAFF_G00236110 [Aldrovandia affinis]|uniref:Uncharacterized protein n=1 Tax=Aldrovandia affinis TaxID=143900 RepID=A0AAD7RHF6_9TELE|nr:hypothetical protein AAFF_G00236110 [Aldrovandia affinis]